MLTDRSVLVSTGGVILEAITQIGTYVEIAVTLDDVCFGVGETNNEQGMLPIDRCVQALADFGVSKAMLDTHEQLQERRTFFRVPGLCKWLKSAFGMGRHELSGDINTDTPAYEPIINTRKRVEQQNIMRNPLIP